MTAKRIGQFGVAVGIGCRKGCSVEDLAAALDAALAGAGRTVSDVRALYAPEFKAEENAIAEIARRLGRPFVLLPIGQLQLQAARALTQSQQVALRFGVPSIAETAALAGASVLARTPPDCATPRLLGPRQVAGGASCALAVAVVSGASELSNTPAHGGTK